MEQMFEKARLEYFFNYSQNRKLRRKMARDLGLMKQGWQNVKEEFPPYNHQMDLGIKKFKKAGHNYKEVLEYKLRARKALSKQLNSKEA